MNGSSHALTLLTLLTLLRPPGLKCPSPKGCGHWLGKFGQKDTLVNAVPSVISLVSLDESLGITRHPSIHVHDLQDHPPVPVSNLQQDLSLSEAASSFQEHFFFPFFTLAPLLLSRHSVPGFLSLNNLCTEMHHMISLQTSRSVSSPYILEDSRSTTSV